MRFRVYYGDGSTYDGDPFYAPRDDVQVIVGPDLENGRYVLSQYDAYWWDEAQGRWFGGDRRGEWDYMRQLGPRVVLYGRFIGNAEYAACARAASLDPDFQPKSAWDQGER